MALYAGPFFCALSFAAYLFTAIYVDEDRKKVELEIKSKLQKRSRRSLALGNRQQLLTLVCACKGCQKPASTQNLIASTTQVTNSENVEKGSDEERTAAQQVPAISQNNKNLIGYANPLIQASSGSTSTN